jgi:hypothetical protein
MKALLIGLTVGLIALLAVLYTFRYESIPNDGCEATGGCYVFWDRWRQRVCLASFDRGMACSRAEATANAPPAPPLSTFDDAMKRYAPSQK